MTLSRQMNNFFVKLISIWVFMDVYYSWKKNDKAVEGWVVNGGDELLSLA